VSARTSTGSRRPARAGRTERPPPPRSNTTLPAPC
jgi:hypothetical protein